MAVPDLDNKLAFYEEISCLGHENGGGMFILAPNGARKGRKYQCAVFSESADCQPKWSATRPLLAGYFCRGHQELLLRS